MSKFKSLMLLIGLGTLIAYASYKNKSCSKVAPLVEILSYVVDPSEGRLHFYWKDENDSAYTNFSHILKLANTDSLKFKFMMNGGMFNKKLKPVGLYVEDGEVLQALNLTENAYGNFYLQPNGVFWLSKAGKAHIQTTKVFQLSDSIQYATQSGPMLVIDGEIHSAFKEGSTNLNIRNGVGLLPSGKLIFALSKAEINFYDFARFFLDKGCSNALYLDGAISKCYLPEENWTQTDGTFVVIIAEIE